MTSLPSLRLRCRQFRARHAEFVDERLPSGARQALRAHRDGCRSCAAFDARVRRALLTVSSLRAVEVSPSFAQRLSLRLAAERATTASAVVRPLPLEGTRSLVAAGSPSTRAILTFRRHAAH